MDKAASILLSVVGVINFLPVLGAVFLQYFSGAAA